MSTALGLRPICEASPPMTAAAIVHNLDLAWLEEELFHHTRIAKDSLEGLHCRFAARVEIFAHKFLSIYNLKAGKSGYQPLIRHFKHRMSQRFFLAGGVFALTIKDKILVKAWQ